MQYLGHSSPKSIRCFLEFTFSWASRVLFGSPTCTSCPLQTSSLGQAQAVGEEKYKLGIRLHWTLDNLKRIEATR